MLKLKSIISMIICVVFVALFTINCDKDKSPTKPTSTGLVGNWKLTKLTVTGPEGTMTLGSSELQLSGYSITITLSNDNKYTWTEIDAGETTVETGTWSVSGNSITTFSSDGETTTFEFTLSDNILTLKLSEGGEGYTFEFTRQ